MRYIEIAGTPSVMGRMRGTNLQEYIASRLDQCRDAIRTSGRSVDTVVSLCARHREQIALVPDLMAEIEGIAEGAKLTLENLLLLYFGERLVSTEPGRGWLGRAEECSVFGRSYRDHAAMIHNYVGKTADVPLDYQEGWSVVAAYPKDGYAYVSCGFFPEFPGGTDAMNEVGLAIVGAGVPTRDGWNAVSARRIEGFPTRLHSSLILRTCDRAREAAEYFSQTPGDLFGSNRILADRTSILLLEASHQRANVVRPSSGYIAASTIFSSSTMSGISADRNEDPGGFLRQSRLEELLSGQVTRVADVMGFAADHKNGPGNRSICRHGPLMHTLGAVTFDIRAGDMWVASGRPCTARWTQVPSAVSSKLRRGARTI